MKKKIVFYLIAIGLSIGVLFFLYKILQPEEMPVVYRSVVANQLRCEEVNEFVYQEDEPVYLFFFSSKEADSQFVIDNMINPILKEYNLNAINNLYYVDVAELSDDISQKYTKNQWGFYNCPTFLSMTIKNNAVEVTDLMEWDYTNPYTTDSVRTWLQEHKLIPQN